MMSEIVQCHKCGTFLHIVRKRYCCDFDYLLNKPIQQIVQSNKRHPHPGARKVNLTEVVTETRQHRKKHSRTKIRPEIREAILIRDGYACVKCGSKDKLQVHHIWHHKYGGGDDIGNLETLCLKCHIDEHKDEPIAIVMAKNLMVSV